MAIEDLHRHRAAHRRMYALSRQDKLDRPAECEMCWRPDADLQWWFEDYRMPLASVMWLCRSCRINPRERIREMATFSQWLAGHEAGAQDDPVAWLARQWKALEGNRPRVSSPSGIEKHLMTLAAGEPAQADQWTGYVHTAVAEATSRYKQAKAAGQSGSNTSSDPTTQSAGTGGTGSSGQAELPGTNPATGKPVAVISSAQWVQHPDASKYGSCGECGWARGLANTDVNAPPGGSAVVMTCAAGHIFKPVKPEPAGEAGPTAAGPAGSPGGGTAQPALQAAGGDDPDEPVWDVLDGVPGDLQPVPGGMGYVAGEGPVDLLALVNLKLTAICVSLGLPTDPDGLMALLLASAEQQQAAASSLSGQLAEAGMRATAGEPRAIPPEPGSQAAGGQIPPWGTAPAPDFGAWYGIADPAATDE